MHAILATEQIAPSVHRFRIHAPEVARERAPGQFVIVQLDDFAERVPLTIADADADTGSITLIFQAVGRTTHLLAERGVGGYIPHVLGPLGQPTHIEPVGRVTCVAGGIGAAPLHPIAKAHKQAGNSVRVILGARSAELMILREEFAALADELVLCTDDGSLGRKALVTEPLAECCRSDTPPDEVVAIGPPVMMKYCAETTRPFGIHTVVSLNSIMIDGTGMCGGCRVTVGGQTRFTCVDGPEFDGHLVDFDTAMLRLGAYRTEEEEAHHRCHLELGLDREGEA
ncbi:MAG: sulfide/dihydroorotate dehydrogenase-like FAD/NAD-binding protein [Planctomycetota bacterium]